MKIIALPEVRVYFHELANLLYEKEYFGFEENAFQYVDELFTQIKTELPTKSKKQAASYFDRYGKDLYYTSFRKNKTTQWYVFFTIHHRKGETIYLIRYISNNHVIAKYL